MVTIQFDAKIRIPKVNNGGEYMNSNCKITQP